MTNVRKPTTNDLLNGVAARPSSPALQKWLRLESWLLSHINRRHYCQVDEPTLLARKRSDTVFVFGSGASLRDITPAEWERIGEHNTFSFNFFMYQDFVRADYHLVREAADMPTRALIDEVIKLYGDLIRTNPFYSDTIFLLQGDYRGTASHRLVGHRRLPEKARIFWYRTKSRGQYQPPSSSFAAGLVHGPGTLVDSINACGLMGFRRIVLAGVDLYDHRYFYLPDDEQDHIEAARGQYADATHSTVKNGIISYLAAWRVEMAQRGQELMVYNPRSLLCEALPIFRFPEPAASHHSRRDDEVSD